MINNDQIRLLLYCCQEVKSHRSGGDTVPLMNWNQYLITRVSKRRDFSKHFMIDFHFIIEG